MIALTSSDSALDLGVKSNEKVKFLKSTPLNSSSRFGFRITPSVLAVRSFKLTFEPNELTADPTNAPATMLLVLSSSPARALPAAPANVSPAPSRVPARPS